MGLATQHVLRPEGQKVVYLLSSAYRPTVAERHWAAEQGAPLGKLGRFMVGGGFMPLQTNMVRQPRAAPES